MLRRVLSNSAVYFLGSALASGISFVVLPLYTRLLSPTDFGVLGLISATAGILDTTVGLNPQLYFNVEYKRATEKQLQAATAAAFVVPMILAGFAFVLLEVLRVPLGIDAIPCWAIAGIAILPVFGNTKAVYLTVMRMREQPLKVVAVQLSSVVVEHGVSLVLLLGAGLAWQGRIAGTFCAALIVGLTIAAVLWRLRLLRFRLPLGILKQYVSFLVPLIPHALGYWAINAQDRFFISRMCGIESVGYYSVAYRLCSVFPLVTAAVLSAFSPYIYKKTLEPDDKRGIVRFTYLYLGAVTILLLLFIFLVIPIVPWLLGESYAASVDYMPWIAGAYALGAVRDMSVGYLFRTNRNRMIGAITLLAAVLNAVLNWLLIHAMGARGAAVATTVSFGVIALVTTWYGLRAVPMPWLSAFKKR